MKTPSRHLAFAVVAAAALLGGLRASAQTMATNLAITSVNGGVSPNAGVGFDVVVQAQDTNGTPANVVTDTTVTLSRAAGTGTLGGTLTGTILAGTSSVTVSNVTYTKAESGVVLAATSTSGDALAAGNSAAFTVFAGPAATLKLTSGSSQRALGLATLSNAFVVTVTDANSNVVSGTSVTFAITTVPGGSAIGQSLSITNATTGTNGQASSTLTLGNKFGAYAVTATSTGLSNSPVTFTANATANLAPTPVNGGINPAAGTGFNVVVQVQGAGGTAINVPTDTTVTLSRTTGSGTLGGTLTGTILASTSSVTISNVTYTKAESGVVLTATRTSGNTVTAGNSAAFTVVAGPAAILTLTSGNNQSGLALATLASPWVVTVTDANSNVVSGTSVTFAPATVPGSATGQSLSITNATTDTNGQASSTLTLGNTFGTYTVTATSIGLSNSPVTFTANATANLAITSVNGGTNPVAGTSFNVAVQVQGVGGAAVNALTDTTVTLSRTTGSGTLGGTLMGTISAGSSSVTISNVTYTKAESGVVLTATPTGGDTLTAGNSAAFTVVAGPAAILTLTSGNNQSGPALAALASPLVVTVTDANSNAVSGTSVTFAITTAPGGATGQSLSITNATTAANGQASSTLTLGNTVGTYTVTATSAGLDGSPVTFTATATANLAIASVNGGTSPAAGTNFNVVVQVRGTGGAAINVSTDTAVTLSRTTGTGTLSGTLTGTILAGTSSATISNVTYTKAETGVVLTATRTSGDTLTAGSSAAFTVVAGPAATLALTSGNNQSGVAGTTLASPFVVTVTDANSNVVSGTAVTFVIATVPTGATNQSLSTTSATTAANGQALSTLTLGSAAGTYTVTATSGSLTGSPATFTAAATAKLGITSVNNGTNPNAGTPFSVVVQAQNAGGVSQNLVANTAVTLSRTSGTGTLGGTVTGTILAGTSSVTISGVTYTKAESGVVLTATRTSGDVVAAGTSAAFTVTAGAAATLALTSGNGQSQRRSWPLTSPFVVTVSDANANPVSGTQVSFAIATVPTGATGQSLSTNTTRTAANGQASATLTTGSAAGTYTVTATSTGLSGSPVTFTATATPGKYTTLAAATNEYQICFKCHSGYAWLPGSPPSGNSPNGTATSPVMTDVAQEFSPMNKSGHPVVTGLDNYPNSTAISGKKGLLAAAMKAPWNVNLGTQTMLCSDCHDATTTNYVASAAQGPHGSAYQFMLRGPNAANWPAVANTTAGFNSSWCANCHNNSSSTYHGGNHTGYSCYACHIVIPHGGKVSRLLGANGGGLPARYAYNNSTSTMRLTGITKSTATGYSSSTCGGCGEHSNGSEKW